jgi:hypothetical protein
MISEQNQERETFRGERLRIKTLILKTADSWRSFQKFSTTKNWGKSNKKVKKI